MKKLLLALLLCLPMMGDTITGNQPRLEMNAARVTFLQAQKTANTVHWQRLKSDCDTRINATAIGNISTNRSQIMTCASLISLADDALTKSSGSYAGEKYARIAWLYAGTAAAGPAGCVGPGSARDYFRDVCLGYSIAYSWAYHDQTSSATEVAAVLAQLGRQCDVTITNGDNPNVQAGEALHAIASCISAGPDYVNSQTRYDALRAQVTTQFLDKMTSGFLMGGSNGEGLEYGAQTLWLLMRLFDAIDKGTGESIATANTWINNNVDALYFWMTPSGRAQTFSYTSGGSSFSCTGCTLYEMMPYGDLLSAKNNTAAVRGFAVTFRPGADFMVRWFREHGDTTRAANMQYWINTFEPYWSMQTSSMSGFQMPPWVLDFLTQDPAQTATDYNLTRSMCHNVTGMNQLICKTDLSSNAIHVFMTGDGGHIGHSNSDATHFQVYVNKSWALTDVPGYDIPWFATSRHNAIMPNGHGSMYDGSISYPGGSSATMPSSPPGTMVYDSHAGFAVARNNATNAYKFTTGVQVADVDATNGVVRDMLLPVSGGLVAILDRVKLNAAAPSVPGPALVMWQCPPVRSITRNTVFNATNFTDWVGAPVPTNGHLYKITTAGTTAAAQPSFNTGAGSTTTDGTVVWTEIGEQCTVSGSNFQVNFASASRTNPVVIQQNATYGTVLSDSGTTLTVENSANQGITAVRDVAYPTPVRLQAERFYSGNIATGQVKTISGYTGACAYLNGSWTITVPNQTSGDGRSAHFTLNGSDTTGLGLNGCIGQTGILNTTAGSVQGYRVRVEANTYATEHTYLTILQPGPSTTSKVTVTQRIGTNVIVGEAGAQVFVAKKTVGSSCVANWSGFSAVDPRTHFVFGFPISTTCWYKVTGDKVDVQDSDPGGGYSTVGTDNAGAFSIVTAGGSPTLTSFSVTCPTSPIVAGVAQNCVGTAKDQNGNTLTSYVGTPTATTGDAQAVIGATGPFVAGVSPNISLTLKTASVATWNLTLTDGAANGSSGNIEVTPAAAASCTLAGIASPRNLGVADIATGTFRDAFSNLAIPTGNNTITSSDGAATLPGAAACGATSCNYSVTLNTAGTQSITLTNAGGPFNCQQTGIVVNLVTPNYLKAK